MASSIAQINNNINETNNENNSLIKKLNRLQAHNSAAGGELKEKNYLYNELLTQNYILLFMILGASGIFMYIKKIYIFKP